ncbi:MAG: Hsp20/alpha crystallin family protein [Chloroflexota bacterium]|nr:Hsp20/alpha crystallin family protein [Chloroflexota bacterium]
MTKVVTRWEPMRDFVTLRETMDRFLEDNNVRASWTALAQRPGMNGSEWRLPLDVYTTEEEIVIGASVPGVSAESVEITVEGDVLSIKGELPAPMENVDYLMRERHYGKFSRSLTINVPVDADSIEATFENGVITVVVPKAEESKPKTIKVQAK